LIGCDSGVIINDEVELFRSFGAMIKRYSDYEMSKLEKLLDDIDKRNGK